MVLGGVGGSESEGLWGGVVHRRLVCLDEIVCLDESNTMFCIRYNQYLSWVYQGLVIDKVKGHMYIL